jgi:hypothetical protein
LVPSIDGDSSVGRVEDADIDIGPNDIVNNLKLGGMIQLEARHESSFGLNLAYNFMDLSGDADRPLGPGKLEADIFQGILEGYGMYRVKTDKGPLDFYGGVRWWDMDIEFKVTTIQIADNSADWVDPVVGLRWMPQITDNWHIILKGDIGGF